MIGEVLGGYRVTAKIGEGGMGVVYRAEHTIMHRKAVVKVLRSQLSTNREMVQRFFNEARAAAAISHPGIVSVFDLGQRDDGCAYIVMDYLEGESLGARLRRKKRLETHESISIVRQILSALSAAHARGIVHRDLKPDNIFIVADPEIPGGERIKLLDFGIAKLQDDAGPGVLTTRQGALMGTPLYMSPEQCRGAGTIDHRADLYAVGVMLFELLTGRPPFVAEAAGDLIAAHMRDLPPKLSDRVSGMPPGLEAIVARLLAKLPEERFESGEATIDQIDTLAGGVYASGVRQDRSRTPSQPFQPHADALAATMASGADMVQAQGQGTTLSDSANSLQVVREPKAHGARRAWLGAALGVAVLGTAATIFAISQTDKAGETPTPAAAVTQVRLDAEPPPMPADAAVSDAVASDAGLDAGSVSTVALPTPLADQLPAIDFTPVSDAVNQKAKRLNKRGKAKRQEGDIEEARAMFLAAIEKDPGHLFARYNYAGILVIDGKVNEAVEILRQLKAMPDCAQCLGRLQRARRDEAWRAAHDDPDFEAVTIGIRNLMPTSSTAAARLAAAIVSGDFAEAAPLIAPREVITTRVLSEGCKGKECARPKKIHGIEALRTLIRDLGLKYGAGVELGDVKNRFGDCSEFKLTPGVALQLRKVCTSLDSAAVRSLSKVEFVFYDPSAALED